MSRLRVAAIVEGDGEVAAVPILLRRLWLALGGEYIEILRPPIRRKRSEFERHEQLEKAVGLAVNKLKYAPLSEDPALVLILFDRDPSAAPACVLGPQALNWSKTKFAHIDIACVVANLEYETWFAACPESLSKYITLKPNEPVPVDPEAQRCGKKWVGQRFKGVKYSATQDQPAMTEAMDLEVARQRSPSFDKLRRDLLKRLHR